MTSLDGLERVVRGAARRADDEISTLWAAALFTVAARQQKGEAIVGTFATQHACAPTRPSRVLEQLSPGSNRTRHAALRVPFAPTTQPLAWTRLWCFTVAQISRRMLRRVDMVEVLIDTAVDALAARRAGGSTRREVEASMAARDAGRAEAEHSIGD